MVEEEEEEEDEEDIEVVDYNYSTNYLIDFVEYNLKLIDWLVVYMLQDSMEVMVVGFVVDNLTERN